MGVAADCSYVAAHGSPQQAISQILTNWNTASALYKVSLFPFLPISIIFLMSDPFCFVLIVALQLIQTTFNVSLGIIHVNVVNSTCPSTPPKDMAWNLGCESNLTLNDRLSLFSQWRGAQGDDGTGLWHLMSGCPTGTEVGVAWLGTLCQQSASGDPGNVVSGTAVSTNGLTEWEVVSHEIGHNFGAIVRRIYDAHIYCELMSLISSMT